MKKMLILWNLKKLIFTSAKKVGRLVFMLILFSGSCQSTKTEEDKRTEVNRHLESYILHDVILIYRDKYGALPERLEDIIEMYSNGETVFGFNDDSIKEFMTDPFSENLLLYNTLGDSSYILYSAGPNGVDNNQASVVEYERTRMKDVLNFKEFKKSKYSDDIIIFLVEKLEQQMDW